MKQERAATSPASSSKFAVLTTGEAEAEETEYDPAEWPEFYQLDPNHTPPPVVLEPYALTTAPEPSAPPLDTTVPDNGEEEGGESDDEDRTTVNALLASGPSDLSSMASSIAESSKDEEYESVGGATFEEYKATIARSPYQILRYGPRPLLMAPLSSSTPDTESDSDDDDGDGDDAATASANQGGPSSASDEEIPPCPACGAPRIFEMQLLNSFLLEYSDESVRHCGIIQSMAWGTVLVYSCSASCPISPSTSPLPEHVVVQSPEVSHLLS